MLRLHLNAEEQAAVEQQYKTTTDRRLRDRSQAVLRAHAAASALDCPGRGRASHDGADVAAELPEAGAGGVEDSMAAGAPQRIPVQLAPTIVEWVKGGPRELGYSGPTGRMPS